MLAAAMLALLVASGPAVAPPAPMSVPSVPAEPGAIMLPEAPTYQAVAVDLDGDGAREVTRLIGGPRGSILVEAWAQVGETSRWGRVRPPVEVVPGRPSPGQGDVTFAGTPVRLLVRAVADGERLTLVRQPRFAEPDLADECCLLLHDLVLADDGMRLLPVADPARSVGALSAIDFDGDGIDELLATRSLPPLGDVSFPTEASVYRWNGASFDRPTVTTLPVGSGDTPFVLGDSDGIPGEEAGIIPTVGPVSLHRVRLGEADALLVEDSELFATDAVAVPIEEGRRGLAIFASPDNLTVLAWPAGEAPGEPLGRAVVPDAALLGPVQLRGTPRLLVIQPLRHTLHVPSLPDLGVPGFTITRSPAAAAFESAAIEPFSGPLPGGGPDGEPAFIYAGSIIPSDVLPPDGSLAGLSPLATLAGAEPVGLVGRERAWMAIRHAPLGRPPIDPSGGRLDPPLLQPGSGVSIAPLELVREGERDDGRLDPPVTAEVIDGRGTLAVGTGGFSAAVEAPPGSRVYLAGADPSVLAGVRIVPEAGRLDVAIVPPGDATPSGRMRLSLAVVTPAGHGYLAAWDVRLLTGPPRLDAAISTPVAAASVVEGRVAPFARLTIQGRPIEVAADGFFRAELDLPPWPTRVEVVAVDPLGNESLVALSGVGLFDYRGLPWIPISVALVGVVGVLLLLRVPRSKPASRADDDAVLEEMEPD